MREFDGVGDLERILDQKRLRRAKWHIPQEMPEKKRIIERFFRGTAYLAVAFSLLAPKYACSQIPVKEQEIKYVQPALSAEELKRIEAMHKEYESRPRQLEWHARPY